MQLQYFLPVNFLPQHIVLQKPIYIFIKSLLFFFGLTNTYPGFTKKLPSNLSITIPYPVRPNRFYAVLFIGYIVRQILLIPISFYLVILGYGAYLASSLGSFSVLFKGYYPETTYDLVLDYTLLVSAGTLFSLGVSDTFSTFVISMRHKALKLIALICGGLPLFLLVFIIILQISIQVILGYLYFSILHQKQAEPKPISSAAFRNFSAN
jgi:hypothetical protein